MAIHDILLLCLFAGAFTLFGGVLGFVSWQESRALRKAEKAGTKAIASRQPQSAGHEVYN